MSLLRQRSVLLAKIESTYNTDPTPTNTADAVLVENLQLSWPTEVVDRGALLSNTISSHKPLHGRKYAEFSFDVELKGSGTAGTAADWGPLVRACGMGETVVASTSVTYLPVSSSFESVTIYAYRDGLLYKATGCRGNVTLNCPAGQRAMLSFRMMGHAVSASDASVPSPTVDSTVPVTVKGSSFTIDSYAAVISALAIDLGNDVSMLDSVSAADGYGQAQITNRHTQGSIDPEAVLVATHNFWSKWEGGTQMALSIAIGSAAGNIATITAPKVTYRELSEADRAGALIYTLPFTCALNAGDDELSIAMT